MFTTIREHIVSMLNQRKIAAHYAETGNDIMRIHAEQCAQFHENKARSKIRVIYGNAA